MKRLWITFVLTLVVITAKEAPLKHDIALRKVVIKTNFIFAYDKIKRSEGYYGLEKNDKGGETYGGIARNFNPNWGGWEKIDRYKRQVGFPKKYQQFKELDFYVQDYFLTIWVREGFDKINNPFIASYIFDMRANGHIGIYHMKQVLQQLGYHIKPDYVLDEFTLFVINNYVEKDIFIEKLRMRRINFYYGIVSRDSTQKDFLRGWINRANTLI